MKKATVFVAAAILICAWGAGAGERKGPDISFVTPKIAPASPAWPGLPPDLEVAIPVGKARRDSVRITVGSGLWDDPLRPAGLPRLGDRQYPGDRLFPNHLKNVEGLLRRRPDAFPVETNIFNRGGGIRNTMNAMSMYFSVMDGGGFGFRMLYDRRIRPALGLNVSGEFTTYGGYRLNQLRAVLPDFTTRLSIVGLYAGLQQRFGDKNRVVPRLGIGAGPVIRVDHQSPPLYGYYYGPYAGVNSGYGGNYYDVGLPLFGGFDFPRLSLSFGGYANAGIDVVVDKDRLYAVSLDARYNLIHFFDALGSPGDFGGPALYVGFGRRF